MRRREFIGVLIGGATPWGFVAAKAAERMRHIGVLMAVAENDPVAQPWVAALHERLEQLGRQIGRTLRIDYRWAAGSLKLADALAKELVGLHPVYSSLPILRSRLRCRRLPVTLQSSFCWPIP